MDIEKIIAFEEGSIAEDDLVTLFQGLVDTGSAWTLQGFYGRTACQLIALGRVEIKDETTVPDMALSHIAALKGEDTDEYDDDMRTR